MGGEHLTTGWEPELPPDDTLLRRAVLNVVDRFERTAERMGGEVLHDGEACAVRFTAGTLWANSAYLLRPLVDGAAGGDGDVLARLDRFFGEGVEASVFSPVPTPDLSSRGWLPMGHPPLMFRAAADAVPPDPDGLVVEEVADAAGLAEWEDTLARAFPLSAPGEWRPGTLYDGRMLGAMRFFTGRVDGAPVCTAAAHVACGVNQVEWVSTLPEHRGRRYGEAVTWRATRADASLPAVLVASDLGRPVYERMGYVALLRYAGWIKPAVP